MWWAEFPQTRERSKAVRQLTSPYECKVIVTNKNYGTRVLCMKINQVCILNRGDKWALVELMQDVWDTFRDRKPQGLNGPVDVAFVEMFASVIALSITLKLGVWHACIPWRFCEEEDQQTAKQTQDRLYARFI